MKKRQERAEGSSSDRGTGNKRTHRTLLILLFAAVLVVFVYSGYRALRQLLTERAGRNAYASLDAYMQLEAPDSAEAEETAGASDSAEEAETIDLKREADYPALSLGTAALQKINPDFAAVLYVPALDLLYPVAYSSDNTEYLTRTFDGTPNPCGSLFVDCNASRDFSDLHTLIYGHNMKNGTMFGSLKKFLQDPALAKENPYFYLYTGERVLRYRIYAYLTLPAFDAIYSSSVETEGDYDALVKRLQSASAYAPEEGAVDFTDHPDLVTLSTCYGTGHTDNFVTCGVLDRVFSDEMP